MKATGMTALLAAVQQAKTGKGGGGQRDEQYFYYPERDSASNGSAVIRFLPGANEDEIPFVQVYSHGFKGPTGKWLIEDCPTSIGGECPVCDANRDLYTSLSKDDARKHGMNRRNNFITRVLVVEDKKNPDNEGKVFLFKFGAKIFDKIAYMLAPTFVDDDEKDDFVKKYGAEAVEVFSLKKGANFKFRIRQYEGNTNYDKSEFDTPSVCKADVEYTEENDIQKFIAKERFKSVEDLQKRLDFVKGNTVRKDAPKAPDNDNDDDVPFETETRADKSSSKRAEVAKPKDEDDDDVLAMMRKLAEED